VVDHDAIEPEGGMPVNPSARRRRRVVTEPPSGSDPAPVREPPRHASTENDDRLKRDKPPHWS
jgi:hypothetical protein